MKKLYFYLHMILFISGEEAIQILTKTLRINPKKVCLGLGYSRLILATLETVWNCVCGSYTNECIFLELEGVFVLLDLLQTQVDKSEQASRAKVANKNGDSLKSVILGCLLDLLENPKSLHHAMTWIGKL